MSFLLDTSALIDVFVNRKSADEIRAFVRGKRFLLSSITIYELNKTKNLDQRITNFLKNCDIIDFDIDSAQLSAKIFKKLQENGHVINEMDILMAGIAINNDLMLVTKDQDFEQVAIFFHEFKVKTFS